MWTNILISHIPTRRIAVLYGNSLLEELPDSFPKQLHHFTVPLAVYECSDFFFFHIHCWLLPTATLLVPLERKYATLFILLVVKYRLTSLSLEMAHGSLALSLTAPFRRLNQWFQYLSRWLFQDAGLLVLLSLLWVFCFLQCLKYLLPLRHTLDLGIIDNWFHFLNISLSDHCFIFF